MIHFNTKTLKLMTVIISLTNFFAVNGSPHIYNQYIGINKAKNWLDASDYCLNTFGTSLATITSDDENNYVRYTTTLSDISLVWFGLYDITSSTDYKWDDGTTRSQSTYTKWNSGEPNNVGGNQDYGQLPTWTNGLWDDSDDSNKNFVCNYPRYLPINSDKSYNDANTYCLNLYGTTLATVTNLDSSYVAYDIAGDVYGISSSAKLWIGLNDELSENVFVWKDGSTYSYSDWNTNEPNNVDNEDCVHMWGLNTNNRWNDATCSDTNPFVCNFPNYIGVNQKLSWSDANDYCNDNFGTTLATILSESDNNNVLNAAYYLGGITNTEPLWFGLNDFVTEGKFVWAEEDSIEATSSNLWYTNWNSGQPNDWNGQDCAQMYSNGGWHDDECTYERHFVCNSPKYIAVKIKKNFDDANNYCQTEFGTSLATVKSETMNNFVRYAAITASISGENPVWIGFTDNGNEGNFYWKDSSSVTYTKWSGNQPDGNNAQNCVRMYGGGTWDDIQCTSQYYFVCNL